ncbi:hypothetical protein ACUR5C_13020 [Aliikangiella sp. IMCC44653]
MELFKWIAVIAIAGIIANLIKDWIRAREVKPTDLSGVEARLDKLEKLQKRVETLEAIVTDKGYDLKSKIDNL